MKKILYLISLLFCFNSLTAQNIMNNVNDGNISCNGGSDGTATVVLNGVVGTPSGLTYLVEHHNGAVWSQVGIYPVPNGVSAFDITGLWAGLFRVSIVQHSQAPIGFVVFQPPAIAVIPTWINIICNGISFNNYAVF